MSRPAKKVKRSASFRSDDTDRMLAQHKEKLQSKLQQFLDSLPQLTGRYYEVLEHVKKKNPSAAPGTPGTPGTPHGKQHKKSHPATASTSNSAFPHTPTPSGPITQASDLPAPPDNHLLLDQLAILKTESNELSRSLNAVTEWIALMIPTIKEEDNAGVEVQMQVHAELMNLSKEIESKSEFESDYLEARANMESKYYKYFLAPSWIKMIEKHDENRWNDLEVAWKELVRIILNAYTLLTNNMEKLKNPRSGSLASFMTM